MKKSKRWTSMLCAVLLCVAASRVIAAQDDPRRLFTEGTEAFSRSDFDTAAAHFRKAYDLSPTWRLLFNIAQAEAAAKRYGLALEAFESYLAEGGDEIDSERNQMVIDEINRLRMLVGNLEVTGPAGATLHVDGTYRATLPVPGILRIEMGHRHIEIRHNEGVIHEATLRIAGGTTTRIEATTTDGTDDTEDSKPKLTPDATETDTPPRKAHPLFVSGIITTGVGAAALIAGSVLGGLAISGESKLADRCPNQRCVDPGDQADIDRVTRNAHLSTALLAAGGATVATGVVLLLMGNRQKNRDVATIRLSPLTTPTMAGVVMTGRW